MKKILVFTFFCLFTMVFAQHSTNRFDNESSSAFETTTEPQKRVAENGNPVVARGGNPGEPVPIEQYTAALMITALGIIIYKTRKNRNLLS